MDRHASVTCAACAQRFAVTLPVSRAVLARSTVMFLTEICPHCLQARTYLKSEYHFDLVTTPLSA